MYVIGIIVRYVLGIINVVGSIYVRVYIPTVVGIMYAVGITLIACFRYNECCRYKSMLQVFDSIVVLVE